MYQQLWGYKVEEKLYLGVREQKRLNTTALGYWKVSARWVPKELTEHHKAQQMGVSLNNLLCYQEDLAFLDKIVTWDETWVHHITPETKRNSMMWKRPSSSTTKKIQDNI
jgi:hypothetical protein